MRTFMPRCFAICLLSTLTLLTSCQLDQEPLLLKDSVSTSPKGVLGHTLPLSQVEADEPQDEGHAFILAGQRGDRFTYIDLVPLGVHVSGSSGAQHTWSYLIDSAANASIHVAATSSFSPGSSYSSCNVSGSGGLEIAGMWVQDSVWLCQEWPLDSSSGNLNQYNSWSGYNCQGTSESFVKIDSIERTEMFIQGRRIDSSSPWGLSLGMFGEASSYQRVTVHSNGAFVYATYLSQYHFWNYPDPKYVGFRYWSEGRYRYGYLKVFANINGASVMEIGHER